MKEQAQKFMIKHGLRICYEVDGQLYKHEFNARSRAENSENPVITHELTAGIKTEPETDHNNE